LEDIGKDKKMSEQQLRHMVNDIIDRVANNDTHLASIECAEELATLATAGWMYNSRGEGDVAAKLFKIALALGYETRRRHESYGQMDGDVWGNALDDLGKLWD
jgi:hypothetical protein